MHRLGCPLSQGARGLPTLSPYSYATAYSARNLGSFLDENMTMAEQVKKICQSAYFQIRNISAIRKKNCLMTLLLFLFVLSSPPDLIMEMHFYMEFQTLSLISYSQHKTQLLVLSKTRKYDHITPTLIQLHWLPIRQRIQFKILLLTWKSLRTCTILYINELLIRRMCQHGHWDHQIKADKLVLSTQKTLSSYGDRAFSSCAPKLWNSLPMDIRCCVSLDVFKNRLKTFLFQSAYDI